MSDTNKREAPANPMFPIAEMQLHLGNLMSECRTERNEATSAAERMFCDGRILLLHELHLYLDIAAMDARSPVQVGRWGLDEAIEDPTIGELMAPCSVCHTHHPVRHLDNYCPHCGSVMINTPKNAVENDG